MVKSEKVLGWVYIPVHAILLPWLLAYLYQHLLTDMDVVFKTPNINLVYYIISFSFLLIFLFRFLKNSFSDLLDNLIGSLKAILLGYLFNIVLTYALSQLMSLVLNEQLNPNTQEIINQTKLNANVMIAVAVLFAPVVEETLFRGVIFGTIHKKSRILAYAVSTLLFSVYHLWHYFIGGFEPSMLLYLLQYIPASLALAWCYEKSSSIWAPIVMHAAVNFISIKIMIG
jgi:membrane protease YdiL (CAAX protease family)